MTHLHASLTVLIGACGGGGGGDASEDAGPGEDGGPIDAGSDAAVDAGPPVCAAGEICRDGVCLPEDLGGGCAPPCEHDADCGDDVCLVLEAPGGFALACGPPADRGYGPGNGCESDLDCRSRRCESSVCGRTCLADDECVPGMICTDVDVGFAAGTYRGCGFRARAGGVQVDEIPLGDVGVARDGAGSSILSLAVPSDAVSLAVASVQAEGDVPLRLGYTNVTAPDTTVLLELGALTRGEDPPLRDYSTLAVDAMLVPNSTEDRLVFEPGIYAWRLFSLPEVVDGPWPETTASVTAWVKRADAPLDAGTLDLVIWPVDIGLTAATAPADPLLQEALGDMEDILGQAGIELGDVGYRDVADDSEAARLGVIDSTDGAGSELADLFRLSAGETGAQVNIFLVRSFSSGINGIAGAIAGPPMTHGTIHSGVAARAEAGTIDAIGLGRLMAHETGHYLGLFHVVENPDGSPLYAGDPIADTDADPQNLMYWSVNVDDPNTDLTVGQGFVMRRSPIVR